MRPVKGTACVHGHALWSLKRKKNNRDIAALHLLYTDTWKAEMSFSGKARLFGSSDDGKENEFLKGK